MVELLVVDTDKSSRDEIKAIVDDSKYRFLRVYESSTTQRAMTLLKQAPPCALIIDCSLPDMDGIQFGNTVLHMYPDLPIIVVTQLKMFEIAQAAINSGFSGYLLKPLAKNQFIDTLDRVLKTRLQPDALQEQKDNFHSDLKRPIHSAVQFIQLHYNEPLTLKELADKVYLSPSYFSRLFKEEIGMTFVEYLSWIRVQKAKNFLRMSSLPIDIIANNTGFANSGYFATTFKKIEGKTPTQYREVFFWEQTNKKELSR